ncbi:RagB/SusD family nutrient uptake outer membrane protein [Flavobacterium sp.]|jgi:hypothetical protein|uniref:RagB/SusD family nutrient uptake outer membrane protein n=1 Tax=Flavobacterium sp. TaxID=239 RepID=UPI0037C05524
MKKIICVLICIISSGCSDFLNVEPREDISISQQFSTLTGTKQALNGAYYQTEALLSDLGFLYADLLGGNITFTPTVSGTNKGIIAIPARVNDFYNFNCVRDDFSFKSYYQDAYEIVYNLNNILLYVSKLTDATDVEKNQIKAEAFALRGLVHFQLAQLFAQTYNYTPDASHKGVVYADKILIGGVDYPARKSVAATYSLIVGDLQQALTLFTANQALAGAKTSYFNAISTKALLAKVALQKRDWTLAKTMANDVIANSGIALMSGENYVTEWEKPSLPVSETILEFSAPINNETGTSSSTVAQFYFLVASGTTLNYGAYSASDDLYLIFDTNDIRRNCFINQAIAVKISSTVFQPQTFRFTKKFQDNAGTQYMRLSEMYLIAAESEARLGNNTAALLSLNTIRQRAGITALTNTTNLLDAVFLERRKELCFEGNLFFDIARFNKNVVRNLGCLAQTCNLDYPNNRFILPIPQSTINVNQNVIQNEGY